MTTTKKELLTIFNHAQQLTPTPTLKDFGDMRKDNNFIALTDKEILERLPL